MGEPESFLDSEETSSVFQFIRRIGVQTAAAQFPQRVAIIEGLNGRIALWQHFVPVLHEILTNARRFPKLKLM